MGLFDRLFGPEKTYVVHFRNAQGGLESTKPLDRQTAIGFFGALMLQGLKVHQVSYMGKDLEPTPLIYFIADACIATSLQLFEAKEKISPVAVMQTYAAGNPQMENTITYTISVFAQTQDIDPTLLTNSVFYRRGKGLAGIMSQQVPI